MSAVFNERSRKRATCYKNKMVSALIIRLPLIFMSQKYLFLSRHIFNAYQSWFCSLIWAPVTTKLYPGSFLWLYSKKNKREVNHSERKTSKQLSKVSCSNYTVTPTTRSLASSQSKGFRAFRATANLHKQRYMKVCKQLTNQIQDYYLFTKYTEHQSLAKL